MDLVWSAILLASFVVGVDVMLDGDADLATRLGGMFRAPDVPGWPRGVQESDGPMPWATPASASLSGPGERAELEEGGPAVASLVRVRPHVADTGEGRLT